jgi:hypothetical protein
VIDESNCNATFFCDIGHPQIGFTYSFEDFFGDIENSQPSVLIAGTVHRRKVYG